MSQLLSKNKEKQNLKQKEVDMQGLVNEKEAARLLGLSVITLRNYRHQRRGPIYYKLGRSVRYSLKDIMEFVEQRRIIPEKDTSMKE